MIDSIILRDEYGFEKEMPYNPNAYGALDKGYIELLPEPRPLVNRMADFTPEIEQLKKKVFVDRGRRCERAGKRIFEQVLDLESLPRNNS